MKDILRRNIFLDKGHCKKRKAPGFSDNDEDFLSFQVEVIKNNIFGLRFIPIRKFNSANVSKIKNKMVETTSNILFPCPLISVLGNYIYILFQA